MRFKFLTFILSLLIAASLAEAGLQAAYRHNYGSQLPYGLRDDRLNRNERLKFTPNFTGKSRSGVVYSTNQYGFRDDVPTPGYSHILFLGDSTTFGLNISHGETFPEKLEKKLALKFKNMQSVNSATPAQGTLDQLKILKEILGNPAFNVKIVVLGFYFNDFKNNLQHIETLEIVPKKKTLKDVLINKSRLLQHLRSLYALTLTRFQGNINKPLAVKTDELGWSFIGEDKIKASELRENKSFMLTIDALDEIAKICRESKKSLIFIDLPPSDKFIFKRPQYSLALENFLTSHAKEVFYINTGSVYVNFLNSTQEKTVIPGNFYSSPGDLGHPGPFACSLIADALEEKILRSPVLNKALAEGAI